MTRAIHLVVNYQARIFQKWLVYLFRVFFKKKTKRCENDWEKNNEGHLFIPKLYLTNKPYFSWVGIQKHWWSEIQTVPELGTYAKMSEWTVKKKKKKLLATKLIVWFCHAWYRLHPCIHLYHSTWPKLCGQARHAQFSFKYTLLLLKWKKYFTQKWILMEVQMKILSL